MPVDPNIYLRSYRGPVDFNDAIIRNQALRTAATRNQIDQGQLQLQQMQLDEATKQRQKQDAIDNAARGSFNNGQLDRGKFLTSVGNVDPLLANEYQTKFQQGDLASQLAQANLTKAQLEEAGQKLKISTQMIGATKGNPQAYTNTVRELKQRGWLDASHPETYPGDQMIDQEVMSGLDAAKQIEIAHQNATLAETKRKNDAEISNQNAARELQKRGQDIQIRGQNMTDARMREQNTIARETKLEMNKAGDENSLASFNADMDRLAAAANELKNHPGLGGITGKMGVLPNIPGGEAANAQAKFDTLKSQIAFATLQNLRNASKTGGALGQVSDREEKMLASNIASLEKSQSKEELQKSLQKIIDFTGQSKERARQAIQNKYQGASSHSGPKLGDVVDGYVYMGGDPAQQSSWKKK